MKRVLLGVLLEVACASLPATAAVRMKEVPTWSEDAPVQEDVFVSRSVPDVTARGRYETGSLGVMLTSYDRESLFTAYRNLSLDAAALSRQVGGEEPKGDTPAPEAAGIPAWLTARNAATNEPLKGEIEQLRSFGDGVYGKYTNCTDPAFDAAAETLRSISGGRKLPAPLVQEWIRTQDAVFALCGDPLPGEKPVALPTELPASSPLLARQLRQYQVAAAHFYAGGFREALTRFDRIAADRAHPQRKWAAIAAMRTVLRSANLDTSFMAGIEALRATDASRETRTARFEALRAEDKQRRVRAHAEISKRAKAIQADATLAPIHAATRRLLAQAGERLVPEQLYVEETAVLAKFDRDPEQGGRLGRWAFLGNRLFDYGGNQDLIAQLRAKHAFFDWIRTIQGCTDNPKSPNATGHCDEERAHAATLWRQKNERAWLVAGLMTASQIDPTVQEMITAAGRIGSERGEYLTVRYHAARLLRLAGRMDEARALVTEALTEATRAKSDDSALNILRQEGFALARTDQEAAGYALRGRRLRLAADGDEWLNRRISSADQLRLSQDSAVPDVLRDQLMVAAWWRADMLGNTELARKAAEQVAGALPPLRSYATAYLAARDADERSYQLALAAVERRLSPHVHLVSKDFGAVRKAGPADYWCSFDSADFRTVRTWQRVPESPRTSAPAAEEMAKLQALGTGADWLARVAATRARKAPEDTSVRKLLDAVIASDAIACQSDQSATSIASARQQLARLAATPPSPALRAAYERYRAYMATQRDFRVFHILVRTQVEAESAMERLRAGTPFEDLAKTLSRDPGSAQKGGDLGWCMADCYVKPFSDAVASMTVPGVYKTPVKTQFGWHVIRVDGSRPATIPSLEEIRPALEDALRKKG